MSGSACAVRNGDMNGPLYDSHGNVCKTLSDPMSKYMLIGGCGFAALAVIGLAVFFLVRRSRRSSKRDKASDVPARPLSAWRPSANRATTASTYEDSAWGRSQFDVNNGLYSPSSPSVYEAGLPYDQQQTEPERQSQQNSYRSNNTAYDPPIMRPGSYYQPNNDGKRTLPFPPPSPSSPYQEDYQPRYEQQQRPVSPSAYYTNRRSYEEVPLGTAYSAVSRAESGDRMEVLNDKR